MFAAAITHFEQGLSLLAEHDLQAMSPVAMGSDIKDIRGVIDRLSGFAADQRVKLARQLPELEATQKALESGEIGIEHALEIARATDDMGAGAEAELLSAAHAKDPAELRQAAREIRHRVDAEGMARQALEQRRKRRLHLFNLPDGMLGLEGALPRVQAETLAGQPGAPAAQLEGTGPISGETARRLLCGGSASVLTVDKEGVALDLGRAQRLASEPQRRVLVAQSRYCNFPGCNWEARFCEPHHLDGWALGGGTSVKRMVLLCKVQHHPLVHEGGWTLELDADGKVVAVPPKSRGPG